MSSTQALESLVPSLQSPVCWADEDETVLVCTAGELAGRRVPVPEGGLGIDHGGD